MAYQPQPNMQETEASASCRSKFSTIRHAIIFSWIWILHPNNYHAEDIYLTCLMHTALPSSTRSWALRGGTRAHMSALVGPTALDRDLEPAERTLLRECALHHRPGLTIGHLVSSRRRWRSISYEYVRATPARITKTTRTYYTTHHTQQLNYHESTTRPFHGQMICKDDSCEMYLTIWSDRYYAGYYYLLSCRFMSCYVPTAYVASTFDIVLGLPSLSTLYQSFRQL